MTVTMTEINVPGAKIKIRPRTWGDGRGYRSKPRMYVWADQEFSVLEDLANRHRRPAGVWRRAVRDRLNGQIDLNLEKMPWSQQAGCSCGCSPGFVLEHQTLEVGDRTFRYFDVYVTLEDVSTVDESKPARELLALGF